MRTFETERLILRPWREDDAEKIFKYASDPRVGPNAGWAPHTSVENSREIIRETLMMSQDTFAVTLKEGKDEPIGSVCVKRSREERCAGEPELGYWIAVPYWGQGLIPEAVAELLRCVFEEKDAERCWCGHFEGNRQSKRVIEKSGFTYVYSTEKYYEDLHETKLEHFYCITREEFLKNRK